MALSIKKSGFAKYTQTTQGKTYIVTLITILTVVIMVAFAITPAYVSVTTKLEENKEKEAYLQQLTSKQLTLQKLISQENEQGREIESLNTYFPNKQNDEFIMANIAEYASLNSVELLNVSFDRNTDSLPPSVLDEYSLLQRVVTTISVTGNLNEFEQFVAALENFPATLTVRSITYSADSQQTGLPQYRMVILAEYYFFDFEI